ncbi:class I SAM-dependent methyltransferase [Tessaracoccus sp. ZS01]|uniref:class I SAM-dependent methyltransferase n=1 Tax=Tessaracoccus sp. ZS01 TaxID=1906324 RepID=UPI00096EE148|nr:methyltransferase [Tessaracoccus sp. ZS01]MCG6566052.1 methyltransferase domain-containing protein [Tessaracoccus sp. ZS01]OMG58562.1 MFS transporter [Tessaracoccus sp. ZS01]
MSHYFDTPDQPLVTHEFNATVFGNDLTFTTAGGVFSGGRLDLGTSVLLREVSPPERGHLLDLGCGVGTIAVGLAVAAPGVTVDAVDVNGRAVELTRMNAQRHGVAERVHAVAPDEVPADVRYDEIWSNPPIRIGKQALHELLLTWLPRLTPDGVAWLVVGKNLGGDSLQRWLTDQGHPTERVASAKGFRVLKVAASEA